MEIVTSWMEEGIEKGLQKGKQEEGLTLVLRLLKHRFGAIDAQSEERIRNLSLAEIESLAEALLDFTAPADLSRWLDQLARGG